MARFLKAKSPVSFPLEDKYVANKHHIVRKNHDATQEKCPHMAHFNGPRDWFERNSQHVLRRQKKIMGVAVYREEEYFSSVVSWSRDVYLALLKENSHGILTYFGYVQNYLKIEGNLKITIY